MRGRPTRQGWIVLGAAVATVLIGRAFGILEMYLIGAALGVAVAAAVVVVTLRRPSVRVRRWIRPRVLTAGDTGRVEVVVEATGSLPAPPFELIEPVGADRTARMTVGRLPRGRTVSAGYRIPTERRGVLTVGPLVAARGDVAGLAEAMQRVAGEEEVLVSPRAFLLDVPELGHGVLGRHLLSLAQRLGAGEFHSLRDYVEGDEPRRIHWRASARSEELKVRQHIVEGLRRVLVVLDQHTSGASRGPDGLDEAFERAVTVAASAVHSADQAGLSTRFVTTGGVDLRGPDVAVHTMHVLARVQPSSLPPVEAERDPGEGLGLVVVITPDPTSAPWTALGRMRDPALTPVGVFTESLPARRMPLVVDARSVPAFLDGWARLAGSRSVRPGAAPSEPIAEVSEPPDDAWALAGQAT